MRITYLSLINFASIFASMNRKKIEIDLSKSKNRIILFVGDNGTGKTSILSTLHPFAYSGNLDVRNNAELILEGENGLKEIHFENNGDIYIIKHHYMYNKSGRTVKSFISKNDTELNPNGNVTSFIELVKMELGIEQDYMKLLRLGSNVVGFMDMKTSDRKAFLSELLADVDIYSQFYKKINDDSRVLKALLKSVSDKIAKLKINEEEDVKKEIAELEMEHTKLEAEKNDINGRIWELNGAINALAPDGVEKFFETLKQEEIEYDNYLSMIFSNENDLKKIDVVIVGPVDEYIVEVSNQLITNEGQITTNTNMINFYFTQLNNYYTQKDEKTRNLKYISSNVELSQLNSTYLQLHKRKEELDKLYKNFTASCTKSDLLSALRILQEIEKFIDIIHEFNHDMVVSTINCINEKTDIDYFVKRHVTDIDDKIARNKLELLKMDNISSNKDKVYVMFKPTECENMLCPYVKYYNDSLGQEKDSPIEKIKADNKRLEKQREEYLAMNDINKNIEYIFLLINSNKELIKKMPEVFFDIPTILKAIKDCIPFYQEEKITRYVNVMEEYEEYESIKSQIRELKKEIQFIEKNSSSVTLLQNELCNIDNDIYRIQNEISGLKLDNERLLKKNGVLNKKLELSQQYKGLYDEIKTFKNEAQRIQAQMIIKKNLEKKMREVLGNKLSSEEKIERVNNSLKQIDDKITDNKMRLKEFKSLKYERALLEERFEEINILKEALSSQKGIPLLFMQLYLRNTKQMVNNLLEAVYRGELEIDDFEINDKEFRIPYVRNNIRISDINQTSQGETSFVSLAFSFALASQSIDKYNIFLLDEVDSTLSQKNRYKFINILEKQLDIINAEQAFMITHNNMFDNYPVDVIMTSPVEIDNYKNMNLIFRA